MITAITKRVKWSRVRMLPSILPESSLKPHHCPSLAALKVSERLTLDREESWFRIYIRIIRRLENSSFGDIKQLEPMRILVIDNDRQTLELVSQFLRVNGHLVDTASKGHQGLKLAALGNYDILVVDRLLPGLDGLSIVQSLRSAGIKSSVLFLTALGSIEDRIEGLDCGGDDYLIKPFALGELLARINALGRRPAQTQEDIILRIADLEVHLIRREVRRAGETISLQPREFKMLEILLRNRGRVITRRMLLEQVWGLEFDPKTTVVQTNVCRLRDKIDRPGRKPLIHTVRGVGYRMDDLN